MSRVKNEIRFEIELDENKVPETIKWKASEKDYGNSKAALISIWDPEINNTLKLDLWTKDMMQEEMNHLVYQTLVTMADTFERATSNEMMAKDIRDFAKYFGKNTEVLK